MDQAQVEMQRAEQRIRAALSESSVGAGTALLDAYLEGSEEARSAFAAVLINRVVVSHAMGARAGGAT